MTDFTGIMIHRGIRAGDQRYAADVKKQYVCYFCEEVVEFSPPSGKLIDVLVNKGINCPPRWRHVKSGHASCNTMATPSNVEVISQDELQVRDAVFREAEAKRVD